MNAIGFLAGLIAIALGLGMKGKGSVSVGDFEASGTAEFALVAFGVFLMTVSAAM